MRDVRYPEKPQITITNRGETEIAYNGLKLYFRTSARGNPIYKKIEKIDTDLEGRIVTENLGRTYAELQDTQRERNLNITHDREDLLGMIEQMAYWYDESDFNVLEEILDKKLKGSPRYGKEEPVTYRSPTNRINKEEQRKQFIDVWRIVFRDNCTPEQAARKLGYDPDDFRN